MRSRRATLAFALAVAATLPTLVACGREPPRVSAAPPPRVLGRSDLGRLLGAEAVVLRGVLHERVAMAWGGRVAALQVGAAVVPLVVGPEQLAQLRPRMGGAVALAGRVGVAHAGNAWLSERTVAEGATIAEPTRLHSLELRVSSVVEEPGAAPGPVIDREGALAPWLAARRGVFEGQLVALNTADGQPRLGLQTAEGDMHLLRVVAERAGHARGLLGERVVVTGRIGLPDSTERKLERSDRPGLDLGVQLAIEASDFELARLPTPSAAPGSDAG